MTEPDPYYLDPKHGEELTLPFTHTPQRGTYEWDELTLTQKIEVERLRSERRQAALDAEFANEGHGPSCRCRDCQEDVM